MSKIELSRRLVLQRAAVAAGTVTMLGAGQAVGQVRTKSPQQSAGYQDKPNGSQRCATCLQFQPPVACKVVAGRISADGWCRIYVPRAG